MTVAVRTDHEAAELRAQAKVAVTPDQARRLLAIALLREGSSREDAARSTGMDRQTLRDWVHRFNAEGPVGALRPQGAGPVAAVGRGAAGRAQSARRSRPRSAKDGVVRWRLADLCGWAEARFQIRYQERGMGKILRALGFSLIRARPAHPQADPERQAG